MRYIIIGAGGTGGLLGAYLADAGRDVALIARSAHLAALRENGLTLNSALKGDICLKNIEAHSAEDDFTPGEVVLVCVKGYSLMQAVPAIAKATKPGAVVIPILNSLQAGQKLQQALPQLTVLDGCIYTSSFITAPGVISHPAPMLRLVFGSRAGQDVDSDLLQRIAKHMRESAIPTELSPHIELDIYKKFCFISAFAATDCYFDVSAEAIQRPGPERELFSSLLHELQSIAQARRLPLKSDLFADTLKIMDKTAPHVTTSMHKDILAGKEAEKQDLLFAVVDLAAGLNVPVPTYLRVAGHFGYQS